MKINENQRRAIQNINGPVLIIAGPGTGKTFTLVERVIHMVSECKIDPSEIMVSTFTNRASLELLDRLSTKFNQLNINKDVNDMLIGNFHSISRKILNEYIDYTPIRKGFTQIDEIEQRYLIKRYLKYFRKIEGYKDIRGNDNEVKFIEKIVKYIAEEGILKRRSKDKEFDTMFQIAKIYEDILISLNMVDYSHILLYTFKLINDNIEVRDKLRDKIKYIMVDEYQDTNTVQEKIIFSLLNEENNLCVVGDDDQGLYRFRGASVRNILEFKSKFDNVTVINLNENYRSQNSIVHFYSGYMKSLKDRIYDFDKYRFSKELFSKKFEGNRVRKIESSSEIDWHKDIYSFLKFLKSQDMVNDLSEVAFIFSSINDIRAIKLANYLEGKGINIYKPKTTSLFSKKEIHELIGAIYVVFEDSIENLVRYRDSSTEEFLKQCHSKFYSKMLQDSKVEEFIVNMKQYIKNDFQLSLYDFIYRIFRYSPFKEYLEYDINKTKNISRFLELINSFNRIDRNCYVINKNNLQRFLSLFFYDYIKFLKDERVSEFDEETIVPKGDTVSFLTIHASKGMEYPIVLISSIWDKPFNRRNLSRLDDKLNRMGVEFNAKTDFERIEDIEIFDFYRKYYTGFSRAKELLVLTGFTDGKFRNISEEFKKLLSDLYVFDSKIKISKSDKKKDLIKNVYSYTTDILPYMNCPKSYYFFRKMKFKRQRTNEEFYGSLVHESIETVNKKIIKNVFVDEDVISKEVKKLFVQAYRNGAVYFNEKVLEKAVKEVTKYRYNLKHIGIPKEVELGISISREKYIFTGNVDMIFERDSRNWILDFKTGNPPDEAGNHPNLRNYYNQINLYASLYGLTKDENIDNVALYFTDVEAEKHLFEFSFSKAVSGKMMELIDTKVDEIEEDMEFKKTENTDKCLNCDMRFFCERV